MSRTVTTVPKRRLRDTWRGLQPREQVLSWLVLAGSSRLVALATVPEFRPSHHTIAGGIPWQVQFTVWCVVLTIAGLSILAKRCTIGYTMMFFAYGAVVASHLADAALHTGSPPYQAVTVGIFYAGLLGLAWTGAGMPDQTKGTDVHLNTTTSDD